MNLKNLKIMTAKKYEVWLANLDPWIRTESGKTRPVLIVQTDVLNNIHPSTLICPITTNTVLESHILRVHLKKGTAKVKENCDIMIYQLRVINNKKLIEKMGELPDNISERVKENIRIVLDLED